MPGEASAPTAAEPIAWIVVGRAGDGIEARLLGSDARPLSRQLMAAQDFPGWAAETERTSTPRWVWNDTATWYPALLDAGVRVGRCHDLRLCHAILRDSAWVTEARELRAATAWDGGPSAALAPAPTLFDLDATDDGRPGLPESADEAAREFARQQGAVSASVEPGRLRLLLAAESAGALIAAELRAAGLPWDAATHDRLLTDTLGSRPLPGGVPSRMAETADRVRVALGDPAASLDSQPKLLRALHRAGVLVESTNRWELAEQRHPAIQPLLEYKRLARLHTANGWTWLDEWIHDGRFRPVYVPAGVVTGRWASSGGGALQLPRLLRRAVRADPGWTLVVADVAQLEPRVLAAMSRDLRLAEAARGTDLYAGVVDSGAVASRAEAKVALLGAMYGSTTGDSGRLLPRLRSTFRRAMALVDEAARVGDDGGVVSTWLGRTSPAASSEWRAAQGRASDVDASQGDEARARRWARDRGRFTRNFVVQGTAAEWALVWMAELRTRLAALPAVDEAEEAVRSGPVFARRAHLAFFLHDEIIVHTPASLAEAVAEAVQDAAESAARLLFGGFPIDFPLDLRISETAEKS